MAVSLINVVDASAACLFLYILNSYVHHAKKRVPLPPGPRGWPIVGNVLDMPTAQEWLTFANWGERFGDICSVTVLGQPIIILNSAKAAFDLLERKSPITSERPVLQMGGELVGWKDTLVLVPPGDRFRFYRRLFHNAVGSRDAMQRFWLIEEEETHKFLRRVLTKPADVAAHIRHTAGAIILRISHGYKVKEDNDPFVELADKATEQFSLSTAPGAYLVDVIPWMRHLPKWLPGTGFLQTANEWAATLTEMVNEPYNFTKKQIAAGTASLSLVSSALEGKKVTAQEEHDIKWTAASLYSGGADTTVSAIYSFFLAMTLHPEVLKKAQAEIDAVIGNDRLPTLEDRPHLPYVDALSKEVLRWNSVVPTGVPHRLARDEIHEGYLLPKGSLVFANLWKLLRDPAVYSDPERFNPERFIASEGKAPEMDSRTLCFGFGRRICPGMHLADASIFLSCAMSLAVFDIAKCVENGVVIEPIHENTSGTISHPKAFKCAIKPRSEKAVALIQAEG